MESAEILYHQKQDDILAHVEIWQSPLGDGYINILTSIPDSKGWMGTFYVRGVGGGADMPNVRTAVRSLISAINTNSPLDFLSDSDSSVEAEIQSWHDSEKMVLVMQRTKTSVSIQINNDRRPTNRIMFVSDAESIDIVHKPGEIVISVGENVLNALWNLALAIDQDNAGMTNPNK